MSTPSTGRLAAGDRARLPALPRTVSTGSTAWLLLVLGRDDVERNAELLEDRPPLRRARREHERRSRRDAHAALAGLPDLLGRPLPRPLGETSRSSSVILRAFGALNLAQRLDLEPVLAQAARIHSPCAELELDALARPATPSVRGIPNCGRTSGPRPVPRRGRTAANSVELRRNTSSPPGRRQPRRLRNPLATGRTRSTRRTPRARGRSVASGSGTSSAFASTAPARIPVSSLHPPRRLELRRSDVDAAPRAAPCEPGAKYAVPQPSSITSLPATSPSTPSSDSGTAEHPPVDLLGFAHASSARASVYSAFVFVQASRFALRRRQAHPGTRARSRAPPTRASPSRARGCPASRARGRRGSSRGRRRPDSSRPSSCERSRSPPRPRARARASAPK